MGKYYNANGNKVNMVVSKKLIVNDDVYYIGDIVKIETKYEDWFIETIEGRIIDLKQISNTHFDVVLDCSVQYKRIIKEVRSSKIKKIEKI